MTISFYYTVKGHGHHTLIIQKSRFLAIVSRAETEKDAETFIGQIKKDNRDANHNCFAYTIGMNHDIQKASDDGEPSGTAGVPMLEVLKKRNLKNTVAVVTRYFGGTKLGAGGLIRAYGKAVTEGLNAAGTVRCERVINMSVTVDYTWIGKLENELHAASMAINDMRYFEKVEISVYVPIEKTGSFSEWITNLTNGQAKIASGETLYLEKDVY